MKDLIKIATAETNVRETPGPDINPRIRAYAVKAGLDWYNSDETPWCSVFLNWATEEAGLERSHDARAASWTTIGIGITDPEPGDIGMFAPTSGAQNITHVGIFMGYSNDKSRIYLLGGNQSDAVNITAFRADTLVGFRRLRPVDGIELNAANQPVTATLLRKGDRGPDVADLQDALKLAGYRPGTSDGIFGGMTESAIRAFQEEVGLAVTGVFDGATSQQLKARLQTP